MTTKKTEQPYGHIVRDSSQATSQVIYSLRLLHVPTVFSGRKVKLTLEHKASTEKTPTLSNGNSGLYCLLLSMMYAFQRVRPGYQQWKAKNMVILYSQQFSQA